MTNTPKPRYQLLITHIWSQIRDNDLIIPEPPQGEIRPHHDEPEPEVYSRVEHCQCPQPGWLDKWRMIYWALNCNREIKFANCAWKLEGNQNFLVYTFARESGEKCADFGGRKWRFMARSGRLARIRKETPNFSFLLRSQRLWENFPPCLRASKKVSTRAVQSTTLSFLLTVSCAPSHSRLRFAPL